MRWALHLPPGTNGETEAWQGKAALSWRRGSSVEKPGLSLRWASLKVRALNLQALYPAPGPGESTTSQGVCSPWCLMVSPGLSELGLMQGEERVTYTQLAILEDEQLYYTILANVFFARQTFYNPLGFN